MVFFAKLILFCNSYHWHRADSEQKSRILRLLFKFRALVAVLAAGVVGLSAYLYESHVQVCKLTGRRKFVCLTSEQIEKVTNSALEGVLREYQGSFMPE